jgi:hypothetical protein
MAIGLNYQYYWLDEKLVTHMDYQEAYPDWFGIDSLIITDLGLRYRLTQHIYLSTKYERNEMHFIEGDIENSNYILGAGVNF